MLHMQHEFVLAAICLVLVPGAGAANPPVVRVTFEDVTARAGITFKHTMGATELTSLVESTGVGCAFLDYDNDGWLDVFLVNGCPLPNMSSLSTNAAALPTPTSRLYHNRGDGTFEDVTEKAGILPGGYGIGVLVGDYDNDGHPDIYVTEYGTNRLCHINHIGAYLIAYICYRIYE